MSCRRMLTKDISGIAWEGFCQQWEKGDNYDDHMCVFVRERECVCAK